MTTAPSQDVADSSRLIVFFMGAIKDVLSTMAGVTVQVGKPGLKADPAPSYDVSAIIGFSGETVGSMVLSFQRATAAAIVAAFAGAPIAPESADFPDAVGELANMIAGSAKKSFDNATSISVPSVIVGSGHVLARLHDVPCIIIPCASDAGSFAVEVSIKSRRRTPANQGDISVATLARR